MTKPYEVADTQRDGLSLTVAELISAYERGIDDLRARLQERD